MSRKKQIRAMLGVLRGEISANASHSRLAAGMANEGYAGGYLQALSDVLLVLDGVRPGGRYDREWGDAMRQQRTKKLPPPPLPKEPA